MMETLVRRIAQHDQKAMSELYHQCAGWLSSVCRRYMPDESDAKDVLQNAFVKIFTSLPTFEYRDELSFRAWMRRIVVNESLRFLQEAHQLQFSSLDESVTNTVSDDSAPDADALTPDQLHHLIGLLPDGYRTVLNLFVFEGQSHRQIAQQLGITESTSASQLFHAKQLLAKYIKELLKQKP